MAKYVMGKKDWEQIKKQAEAQIKDASIVLMINTHILDIADEEISMYKDESKTSSNDIIEQDAKKKEETR